MKKACFFNGLTLLLVIIGAVNWGLVAFFDWNLVEVIFGYMTLVTRIIYAVVALSGIWQLYLFTGHLGGCKKGNSCSTR